MFDIIHFIAVSLYQLFSPEDTLLITINIYQVTIWRQYWVSLSMRKFEDCRFYSSQNMFPLEFFQSRKNARQLVKTVETVETVDTVQTVQTVKTVKAVQTAETENLKKYDSLTDQKVLLCF